MFGGHYGRLSPDRAIQSSRRRLVSTIWSESEGSIAIALSGCPSTPVVTSYFPAGAALVRNLPLEVKTGQAVELTNNVRGMVCGLETVVDSKSCCGQGLIGLIDRLNSSTELLTGTPVRFVENSVIRAKKINELVECGTVALYEMSDICSIQYQSEDQPTNPFQTIAPVAFHSSLVTNLPLIDIVHPIAKGHRVFLRVHHGYSTISNICLSQSQNTLVVWIVIGSKEEAARRQRGLEAARSKQMKQHSDHPSVLIIAIDLESVGLYAASHFTNIISQLISWPSLHSASHATDVVLIFEKFNHYWKKLESIDFTQKSVMPPHLSAIIRSSVSNMLSLMSLAGAYKNGQTITTILTVEGIHPSLENGNDNIITESLRSEFSRDFDLLTNDVTDVRAALCNNRIDGRISPYFPEYQKPLLRNVRERFADAINNLAEERESVESRMALKICIDDWEHENVRIHESLMNLALMPHLNISNDILVNEVICVIASVVGIPLLQRALERHEVRSCRKSVIHFIRTRNDGALFAALCDSLNFNTNVDGTLSQLESALVQFWSNWNASSS